MRFTAIVTAVAQLAAVMAAPTAIEKRISCTLTSFNDLAAVKASCTTITIGTLTVPAGKTLDLTDLPTGTKVVFAGTVTFGYKEWVGPLVSVSGTQISVTGKPGHCLDGHGESWWDGKGGNGGKVKVCSRPAYVLPHTSSHFPPSPSSSLPARCTTPPSRISSSRTRPCTASASTTPGA